MFIPGNKGLSWKKCELATFVLNILSPQPDKLLIDPVISWYNNPNGKIDEILIAARVNDGRLKFISFVNIWGDLMYGIWSFIDICARNYFWFSLHRFCSHERIFNRIP